MKYFQLPNLKTYLMGIPILIMIAVVSSITLPSEGSNSGTLIIGILSGLILGHLVGVTTQSPRTVGDRDDGMKTVYVGNLSFSASRYDLANLFQQYGTVHSSRIMIDRTTRKSRGFGFVEMSSRSAEAAIAALDGVDFSGRNIRVNEATQQTPHHRR